MTTTLVLSKNELDIEIPAVACRNLHKATAVWKTKKCSFETGIYALAVSGLSQSCGQVFVSLRLNAFGGELLKTYARWSLDAKSENNRRVLYFEIDRPFSGSVELHMTASEPLGELFVFKPTLDLVRVRQLNSLVDEVFVINLDRRSDRLAQVASQLEQFDISWTRVSAFDGALQPWLDEWRTYAGVRFSNPPVKPSAEDLRLGRKAIYSAGAWAYLKTYINLLEECVRSKKKAIAIFDDDAVLHREFPYHFSKALGSQAEDAERAEILFLGQTHLDGALTSEKLLAAPPTMSCGSFALILKGNAISDFLDRLKQLAHPVDGEPLRSLIKEKRAMKFTENLVVARIGDSDIQPIRSAESFYKKQGWNPANYDFNLDIHGASVEVLHRSGFYGTDPYSVGVSSRDRFDYLEQFVRSWDATRNKSRFCELVVADSSRDGKALRKNLELLLSEINPKMCRVTLIQTRHSSVTRQTNLIFEEFERSLLPEDAVLFVANDDLIFSKSGWESLYEEAIASSGYQHLVFFDDDWARGKPILKSEGAVLARVPWRGAQGAFFTVTRQILREVGHFDAELFPAKGGGHLHFTRRCAEAGFNDPETLFDAAGSESCLKLQPRGTYTPTGGFLEYLQQIQVNSQRVIGSLEERLRTNVGSVSAVKRVR